LQIKFKPLLPKHPRPHLLPRHVSENLPKPPAGTGSAGLNYEQIKQAIYDCMSAMIEKHTLAVQVRRGKKPSAAA
jgi:hypothetical protein